MTESGEILIFNRI